MLSEITKGVTVFTCPEGAIRKENALYDSCIASERGPTGSCCSVDEIHHLEISNRGQAEAVEAKAISQAARVGILPDGADQILIDRGIHILGRRIERSCRIRLSAILSGASSSRR